MNSTPDSQRSTSETTLLPEGLPADVRAVLAGSLVCEYASLTRDGRAVTWPVTPYVGNRGTLDVSTGLSYPDKAERARRNPQVALLFSDPIGLPRGSHPIVLVHGRATVRDADLQANTDRYVRDSLRRTTGFKRMPWFLIRRLGWYFTRIWVEVTPEQVIWWPNGDLTQTPTVWQNPSADAPASDPGPRGARQPGRRPPPTDWRPFADRAASLGRPVITTTVDGRPEPLRVQSVRSTTTGYAVVLPNGGTASESPACLTFHKAGEGLSRQENVVLVGQARPADGEVWFEVERALNDWSIQTPSAFFRDARTLKERIKVEAARRGQPVPTVRRS